MDFFNCAPRFMMGDYDDAAGEANRTRESKSHSGNYAYRSRRRSHSRSPRRFSSKSHSRSRSRSRSPSRQLRHSSYRRSQSPSSTSAAASTARLSREHLKSQSSTLFIGNVPYHYTEEDMKSMLTPYGNILSLSLPFDQREQHNKG
jgi:RNA recognition motif. (a.k.a. RRM, RBD, or RNP domain)